MSPRKRRRSSSSSPEARIHKSPDGRLRDLYRRLCLAGLLITAVLLVYGQVWQFDFILYDDPNSVSDNAAVKEGLTRESLKWSFVGFHDFNWIPFTWLSLMLDTEIHGFRPGGYHITNVVLHAANTLLLFGVLARATQNQVRSAVVAALFAIHPLHVESVAWIAERKDVLSIFFGLLSLWTYVNYAKSGKWRSLAVSMIWFVCSMMSKQTLVTLPFVFLLLDYWPLRRLALPESPVWWNVKRILREGAAGQVASQHKHPALAIAKSHAMKLIAEKLPFLAVSIAFSFIVVLAQRDATAHLAMLPLRARCMNAVVAYATYLRQSLAPYDLAVFYPHPMESLTWLVVVGPASLLLAICVIAIVGSRRYPFLFVGWYWYVGTLVPLIGIVQVGSQQMADRYTYFPLIGLFLAVVWLIPELLPESGIIRRRVLPAVAIAVLAGFSVTAFVQVGYWRNGLKLFGHALECTKRNSVASSQFAHGLIAQRRYSEAIPYLQEALDIAPEDEQSQYSMGFALQNSGKVDAAITHYKAAIALDDRDADAFNNLGSILSKRGQIEEAKGCFFRAIEVDRNHAKALSNLGGLYRDEGNYANAIAYCERALQLDPNLVNCHFNIAVSLRGQGRLDEAISRFKQLLTISPNDRAAQVELLRTTMMKHGSLKQ